MFYLSLVLQFLLKRLLTITVTWGLDKVDCIIILFLPDKSYVILSCSAGAQVPLNAAYWCWDSEIRPSGHSCHGTTF